jgi:hypothetical protein
MAVSAQHGHECRLRLAHSTRQNQATERLVDCPASGIGICCVKLSTSFSRGSRSEEIFSVTSGATSSIYLSLDVPLISQASYVNGKGTQLAYVTDAPVHPTSSFYQTDLHVLPSQNQEKKRQIYVPLTG